MVTFVTEVTKGSLVAVVTVLTNVTIYFLVTMITSATKVTRVTNIHWLLRHANGPVEMSLTYFPNLVNLGTKRRRVVTSLQPL
jgi:hypothetical protein